MTTLTVIKTPEGDERLEQLKEIYALIENSVYMVGLAKEKLVEYGVTDNMHVGKQKEDPSYFDNQQYLCEYFMGQILNVINGQAWFAMNSVLNAIYGYLERVKEEESYA